MRPDYLMKCAYYKYNTLLGKGEWDDTDTQGKEVLALRAEINDLNRSRNRPTTRKHLIHVRKITNKAGTMTEVRLRLNRNVTMIGKSLRQRGKNPLRSPNSVKHTIGTQPRPAPLREMDVIGGSATNRAHARD